ncbi:hypothetical protein ACFV4M_19255 [Kitasatospora indigofera]|uniref:hypothetical protein n=1 Tax=Kitasatospora indigofera TaxID=67307 RepID=UPI00364ECDA6
MPDAIGPEENGERPVEPSWPAWLPELEEWLSVADADDGQPGEDPGILELIGGPLDGAFVDAALLCAEERAQGLALTCPGCGYPHGRSLYDPIPGRPGALRWAGDIP